MRNSIRKISLVVLLTIILLFSISCGWNKNVNVNDQQQTTQVEVNDAVVPLSMDECRNRNKDDIIQIFKDAGFTNVTSIETQKGFVDNLPFNKKTSGNVFEVTISGYKEFVKGQKYEPSVEVKIRYYE